MFCFNNVIYLRYLIIKKIEFLLLFNITIYVTSTQNNRSINDINKNS